MRGSKLRLSVATTDIISGLDKQTYLPFLSLHLRRYFVSFIQRLRCSIATIQNQANDFQIKPNAKFNINVGSNWQLKERELILLSTLAQIIMSIFCLSKIDYHYDAQDKPLGLGEPDIST